MKGTGNRAKGLCGTCSYSVRTRKGYHRYCGKALTREFIVRDHAGVIIDCDDYEKTRQHDVADAPDPSTEQRELCRGCRRFVGGECTHGWRPAHLTTPAGGMWTCRGEVPTKNRMRELMAKMEEAMRGVAKRHNVDLDSIIDNIQVERLPNDNVKLSGKLQPKPPEPEATRLHNTTLRELLRREGWLDARSKWPSFVRDQISKSKPAETEHQSSSQRPMLKYDGASSEWRVVCGHVAKLKSRLAKAERLLRWLLVNTLTHLQAGCGPDCPACAVKKFLEDNDEGADHGD